MVASAKKNEDCTDTPSSKIGMRNSKDAGQERGASPPFHPSLPQFESNPVATICDCHEKRRNF